MKSKAKADEFKLAVGELEEAIDRGEKRNHHETFALEKEVPPMNRHRREVLKKIGGGAILGLGAGALIGGAQTAKAQDGTSLAYASWVHGHTGQIERRDWVRGITPYGFHLEIMSMLGPFNWVHYGIPTPVIINDRRLRLKRVMLKFATQNAYAWVDSVHVWDGPTCITTFDNLGLSGDHPFEVFDIPGTPSVHWGIGVSIGFLGFYTSQRFTFSSVGADFVV